VKRMDRRAIVIGAAGLLLLAVVGGSIAYVLVGHRSPSQALATPTANPSAHPSANPSRSSSPGSTPPAVVSQTAAPVASAPGPGPSPREGAAIAYDGQRKNVVLFGGLAGPAVEGTWTWDGIHWTQQTPSRGPSPRYGATMTYDAGRGLVVLFGGNGGSGCCQLTDTWTWNGSDWTPKYPVANPPTLLQGTTRMEYDVALDRVVLFTAGVLLSGNSWVSETWTWDGTNWKQLTPPTSPTFPYGTDLMMGYFPPSKSMILVTSTQDSLVTWAFNGTTWSRLAPQGAITSGRNGAGMAYDAGHHTLVLFGGYELNGGVSKGTWTWNGSSWGGTTPPPPAPTPDAGPMVFDAAHGTILLFGGAASNAFWTWDGTTWHLVGQAANYPSALEAGIAGAKAKTGFGYGTCSTSPCLTGSTVVGNTDRTSGLNAAYVQLSAGAVVCYSYVYFESAGWHYLNVTCPKGPGGNPVLGSADTVRVSGGCANIRANPSLNGSIVDCLKDGTSVTIDSTLPRYVDGHIWWSLNNGRGWMAHDFLVTG
jgi:galactose oxidase-like protein